MSILTITADEAYKRLQASGFAIGKDKLYAVLKEDHTRPLADRRFPFGFAVSMGSSRWEYVIFAKALDKFIVEQGGEVVQEVPEAMREAAKEYIK